MSLDITIISPKTIQRKTTGIYARIDGETRELTREEAINHFPDIDPSEIAEHIEETNEFWHGNITHNLTTMASECIAAGSDLYNLLWRDNPPEDIPNYIYQIFACLIKLQENPDRYKQYNPDNGWGTYEQLVKFTKDFLHALIEMPAYSTIDYSR